MPLSSIQIIISAYILDLILGDPKYLPHPVRWIGKYITFIEDRIRKIIKSLCSENTSLAADYPACKPVTSKSPPSRRFASGVVSRYNSNRGIWTEKIGGIFLFIIIVGTVYSLTWFFLYISHLTSNILHLLLSVFFAYTTLSLKSLHKEAYTVVHALENISIDEARKRLAMLVGRDTQDLSIEEIYRAVIETVSENTSDGIIAPLFYLALGGVPLALTYKAVNTLDSMVGYKNERYKNLGWFSAKMDDVFNFIPARLTAFLMLIAAFVLRLDWKNCAKIICRDARNHTSPNAGWPEAAVAGALNCQLGGDNYYFGELVKKPLIGDAGYKPTRDMIYKTVKIMHITAIEFIVICIIVSLQ